MCFASPKTPSTPAPYALDQSHTAVKQTVTQDKTLGAPATITPSPSAVPLRTSSAGISMRM